MESSLVMALGALLLTIAVVFFILQPIITGQKASMEREDDEPTDAEARRRVKLLALRDVEYDFATGKLDPEDYRDLKKELSAEALQALDDTEREDAGVGTDELEAEIARVRQGLETGATCRACGYLNPEGSRFCSSCGRPLEAGTTSGTGGGATSRDTG